jgi:hypothetical protein
VVLWDWAQALAGPGAAQAPPAGAGASGGGGGSGSAQQAGSAAGEAAPLVAARLQHGRKVNALCAAVLPSGQQRLVVGDTSRKLSLLHLL